MDETPSQILQSFLFCFKGFANLPIHSLPIEAFVTRIYIPSDVTYFYEKLNQKDHVIVPSGIRIDPLSKHLIVALDEIDLEHVTLNDPDFYYVNIGFARLIEEIEKTKTKQSLIFDLGAKTIILNDCDIRALNKQCRAMKETIQEMSIGIDFGIGPEQ